MRANSVHHSLRSLLLAGAVPALLLTAVAAAGPARAAGSDFQYVGQDDRVHQLASPKGCVDLTGGGTRAVTNGTRGTVSLHRDRGCAGPVVAVLRAGEAGQVRPYFASARFPVTG
jgi:hypothetical protein